MSKAISITTALVMTIAFTFAVTASAFAHGVQSYDPPSSNCQGKNVSGHLAERRADNGSAKGGWKAVAEEVHGLTVQQNQAIAKADCGTGNFGE